MTRNKTGKFRFLIKTVLTIIISLIVIKLLAMMTLSQTSSEITQSTPAPPPLQPEPELSEKDFLEKSFDPLENFDIDENAKMDEELTIQMKIIVEQLREQIERETTGYKLPSGRALPSLFPEEGGTPMRSLVITTWRSGSTFIGGVLNSHPATFHYSEPLTDYRTVQVRGEPLGSGAVRALRSLLTCNYRVLGRYLERNKHYTWLFTHNTRLWQHCSKHPGICWKPQFLRAVCRLFPFQSMKVVHIRLRLVEELLADPQMNVRVVLLIRDPRGVLHSRSSLGWCLKHEDCSDPVRVCADSVDDYSAALRFSKLFPDKFKVVRYEDMSLQPTEVISGMFDLFGLQYHPEVRKFVNIHTSQPDNHKYSTYRNSSANAFHWRDKMAPAKVKVVQDICRVALDAWGYVPAHNATHQKQFYPITEEFQFP